MALIFFDLDGTCLKNGQVVKGIKSAIESLKKNNHKVAIATGRSPILLCDIDKKLGVDYLVLANGSYVTFKGKEIYTNYISNSTVKKMMDFSDENDVDLVVEYIDEYVSYRKASDIADRFSKIFKIDIPKLDHTFYPNRNVFAMVVFKTTNIKKLEKEFPNLQFSLSNAMGYDVNNKGDLKAEGVKALIEYLDYSDGETFAIGDGYNDLTMIKSVKHGIAMGNANRELKEAAEYVTTNVDDNGVVNALKHYKLI